MRSFIIISIIATLAFVAAKFTTVHQQGMLNDNGELQPFSGILGQPIETISQLTTNAACITEVCAEFCINYARNNGYRFWEAWCNDFTTCRCNVWN